jgi:L-ascorbate metabolism protein UlaG (beta-lactamase superfamily)
VYDLRLGKDHDFDHVVPEQAPEALRLLQEEWRAADEAVAEMAFDDTFEVDGDDFSLRMTYVHMIGEYARHNGHADLLRESIDAVTGR